VPTARKGLYEERYTLDTSAWLPYTQYHPALEAWILFQRSVHQYKTARRWLETGYRAHPTWRHLSRNGRCKCGDPSIQCMPRLPRFRECIQPAPGHLFVVADFSYSQLCALAQVSLQRFGYSMLTKIIADGVDPHCFTAAMFYGKSLQEFQAMKDSALEEDRDAYAHYRAMAKILNFGVAGGLGSHSIVKSVKEVCGDVYVTSLVPPLAQALSLSLSLSLARPSS
jgi:hypothetical protein